MDETDLRHLRRCVELAEQALDEGDEPFGSVLVTEDGAVLAEDRNRVAGGDRTRHPEFELARWAAANLPPQERRTATVYTSGEHCPMCAAAHAWVGLGRIVYATSTAQLITWLGEWRVAPGPVAPLPIGQVAPGTTVDGPSVELEVQVKQLYRRAFGRP
jgi:tRNA(Arg) A34 adenosine deaminase TadA